MNLQELNELDFSNIGNWPLAVKLGMAVALAALLLFAGYWFDTQEQLTRLEQSESKEQELKQQLSALQAKAVNLEAYKEQLAEMRESFGAMIRQLPNTTEVAELLVDVSQTGLSNGLEFDLFQPAAESPKEFYAELPIALKVVGHFHEFGAFVSGLASLPRIVTLHDIRIRNRGSKDDPNALIMEATAKTYRYLDDQGA
ncbi:MAG: type 4a pilus biogenesis protein PilO [Chromatiales bacterium]|nr:type 4a pilus biogenesis protein PilO [Chromatiales bacterium]